MNPPLEDRIFPPIAVYAIPAAPALSDDRTLARIYNQDAHYLDTVHHQPDHDELTHLAALHGWTTSTPLRATRWQNPHDRDVILLVAHKTPPRIEHCDHGRAIVVVRRAFQGPLRNPPSPDAHCHYTEIRLCQSCHALQLVNVGLSGAREPSAWFTAPDQDTLTWPEIHQLAVRSAQDDTRNPNPDTPNHPPTT